MCGLVGAFRADNAKFDHKIHQFMEKGLYVSAVRGMEGTGVGIVNSDFSAGFAKSAFDSSTFLQTRQYGFAKNLMLDARVIMGHTRHSTIQGSISQENSHPFHWKLKDKEILLTHNGHINNYSILSHKDFHHQVDSAHVANALLFDRDVAVLEKMMGFYVCIWYDRKERTLKIARNNTRDLYYVYNKAHTQIYYASEAEILDFILRRQKIETEDEYHEINPGELMVWDLQGKTLAEPKVVNYKEKKATSHWEGTQTYGARTTSGTTAGTGGSESSGRPFSYLGGVFDPPGHARMNDIILMRVKDFDANFVTNGHRMGGTKDDPPHPKDWGHLFGHRPKEPKSVIKLQCQRDTMTDLLIPINGEIPCIVKTATLQTTDEDGKRMPEAEWYWYYECSVDQGKARLAKHRHDKAVKEAASAAEAAKGGVSPLTDGSATEPGTTKVVTSYETGTPTEVITPQGIVPLLPAPSKSPGKAALILSDLVPGPGPSNRITRQEWREMALQGCFFCQGQITELDIGHVAFYKWPTNPEDEEKNLPPDPTDHQIICPLCTHQCDLKTEVVT